MSGNGEGRERQWERRDEEERGGEEWVIQRRKEQKKQALEPHYKLHYRYSMSTLKHMKEGHKSARALRSDTSQQCHF